MTELLEDLVYHEGQRLERSPDPQRARQLHETAQAILSRDRPRMNACAEQSAYGFLNEIHGNFNPGIHRFATRWLPPLLSRVASPLMNRPLASQLEIQGPLDELRELERSATLIYAPTHVSNLDSPVIGFALHLSGLQPAIYGAGLNLFGNPVLGWWMRRLGAYTVDRTKRSRLYKQALKDYSVWCLTEGRHSLFFPGGTRCRSGALESKLKKGLLGTAIEAWQENIQRGKPEREVFIVPVTLSFALVPEARTLIADHLTDKGRQRHIITNDETASPTAVARYLRRRTSQKQSLSVHFGHAMDVFGNPAPHPSELTRTLPDRIGFVCDPEHRVEVDPQRDRVYTNRLADKLVEAYPVGAARHATHIAAAACWHVLCDQQGTTDALRLLRIPKAQRSLDKSKVLTEISRLREVIERSEARGVGWSRAPCDPRSLLEEAITDLASYHSPSAFIMDAEYVQIEDMRLTLYYANRCGPRREGG